MYDIPSIADFKAYFVRDFPFQPDPPNDPPGVVEPDKYVQDSDIQKAMDKAEGYVNQCLFTSQKQFTIGFQLMTAHILCMDLKASSAGLSGSFSWPAGSKSVGSVSVSQAIPDRILKNPMYSWFTLTNYGAEYLMMIYPYLSGVMFVLPGGTTP